MLSPLPLSYCTNVHPGRSLAEVDAGLDRYALPVQRALGRPIGAGLWLAQPVVGELLLSADRLDRFTKGLADRALTCYTLNAFPFGDFHSARVKEHVYLPDWSDLQRTLYTERCAAILAALLPPGVDGSMSTLPLGFKPFNQLANFVEDCIEQLLAVAVGLQQLEQSQGKTIRLAIEPEPFCILETTEETISFFNALWQTADRLGIEAIARRHIGICYDICHQAVEFEDAATSIIALDRAGIRINKVHISCALELPDPAGRAALKPYIEPRYLHQTMVRTAEGSLARFVDLNEDLLTNPPAEFTAAGPWRVHFHVPVSAERMGTLLTTRAAIPQTLQAIAKLDYAPHLEVETYTWEVLPGSAADLISGLAGELNATHQILQNLSR